MTENTTVALTFHGPARLMSALDQLLREEGVTSQYEPPIEYRDLASAALDVTVAVIAAGPTAAITIAVKRFLERFPGTRVDNTPAPALSVRDRLQELKRLHDDATIDQGEFDRERARILGDL